MIYQCEIYTITAFSFNKSAHCHTPWLSGYLHCHLYEIVIMNVTNTEQMMSEQNTQRWNLCSFLTNTYSYNIHGELVWRPRI